jgi:hypothetical protein
MIGCVDSIEGESQQSRLNEGDRIMQRHLRIATVAVAMIASIGFGCVGGSKSSQATQEALKQFVLETAPTDIPHSLNTVFEGKAKLLGYRVSPEKEAKPGSEIKLTMYWECLDDIPEGWNLFTHVVDANDSVC